MSEEITPDTLTDQLRQFSPQPVDVDTLLFEAGRASAKPNRYWKIACLLMLVSHALWLAIWCRSALPPNGRSSTPEPRVPTDLVMPTPPPDSSSYLAIWQQISVTGDLPQTITTPDSVQDDEPLTAFTRRFLTN